MSVWYTAGRIWTVFLIFSSQINCIRGDCGPPPVIPHTRPVAETSGVPGDTVVYVCDRNNGYYDIPDQEKTITCKDDNTWSSVPEFCARACGVPERLSFAVPKESDLSKDIFLPGTKVSYDCRPGFRRVPGSDNSVTCLDNLSWSAPSDFCTHRDCGHPGDIENGDFEAPDGFRFGSRVTYKCNEGYRLSNRKGYRDCQADGKWTNVLPQCDAAICPAPDKPTDGMYDPEKDEYTYLDAVTFKCSKGLHVIGTSSASCTSNGTWSDSSPTCKAVSCPDPAPVQNGIRVSGFVGPYTLNSAVRYECQDNFVMKGSSSITCTVDSQWSHEIPKCLIKCHSPNVDNSRLLSGGKNVYVHGDSVEFECKKNFVLHGSKVSTCKSLGQWDPSHPKCKATCRITEVDNTKLKVDTERVYVEGEVLVIECKEGYVLSDSDTITCSSQGQWKPSPLVCKEPEKGLSTGAIVGIVIGILAVLLAILVCCCCCLNNKSGVYICENKNDKFKPTEQELIESNNSTRKSKSETLDVHYTACNDA
ncbi:complement decay-accelerating factor-like isoform X3 [Ranitomeya variabilis]|uniref:complement decay-accelerating factor-like isoform X3 n=1 Tax=Ranitomeya variabilis TaxID=490064 RepID=UPI00405658C7